MQRRQQPHQPNGGATTTTATTACPSAATPSPRGLYAYVGSRVVELLTEQQLFVHVTGVLPQLKSVTTRPHFHGPHWTAHRHRRHGVELFEFDPRGGHRTGASPISTASPFSTMSSISSYSPYSAASSMALSPSPSPSPSPASVAPSASSRRSSVLRMHGFQSRYRLPNPGMDMAYAAVAQCELDCPLEEVLEVLFSDEPSEFEAAMNTLWGNTLKRGDLLLTRDVRRRHAPAPPTEVNGLVGTTSSAGGQPLPSSTGRLTIKSAALATTSTTARPLTWTKKLRRSEKLCFTTYTERVPGGEEAFHVLKTLPLDVHNQIACGKSHAALKDGNVDHIAVGYHLTNVRTALGAVHTRMVLCAYVSTVKDTPSRPQEPSSSSSSTPRHTATLRASMSSWYRARSPLDSVSETDSGRCSGSGCDSGVTDKAHLVNAQARAIVLLLAKASRDFQRVLRRRRFGNQSFVYFPVDRDSTRSLEVSCVVCHKRFGFLRKDHYCQLCGHLVCRKCSRKYEVEPVAGRVRENRICCPCVARVDTSAFDSNDSLWTPSRKLTNRPLIVHTDTISPAAFAVIQEDDEDREGWLSQSTRGGNRHEGGFRSSTHMGYRGWNTVRNSDMGHRQYGWDEGTRRRSVSFVPTHHDPPAIRRPDIEVAEDLFSPNPARRASALEALSMAVLSTPTTSSARMGSYSSGSSSDSSNQVLKCRPPLAPGLLFPLIPPRAGPSQVNPTVVTRDSEEKTRELESLRSHSLEKYPYSSSASSSESNKSSTEYASSTFASDDFPVANSDGMDSFPLCYPDANPTAILDPALKDDEVQSFNIRHTGDCSALDALCKVAATRLKCCMAYVSVIEQAEQQCLIASYEDSNSSSPHLPRHCRVASPALIAWQSSPLVVQDPTKDVRCRHMSMVLDSEIRFLAQIPIKATNGLVLAVLCVASTQLRDKLTVDEASAIRKLSKLASELVQTESEHVSL